LLIFGPVPSRRLGRSLGINNIPPKVCSYACIYCQLGRTKKMRTKRACFYEPDTIKDEVESRLSNLHGKNEKVDYLTFVADGEPTLDINLGKTIAALKEFGVKTAVITNASLIYDPDVRDDLARADWVSLKCDAVSLDVWREINRPYGWLDHEQIMNGMLDFREQFDGELATETMLIKGINDNQEQLHETACFLKQIQPDISYISIPTRPPAEDYAVSPQPGTTLMAYQVFARAGINVEFLTGYEGDDFSTTGDIEKDLLTITSVHPMKRRAVENLLKRSNKEWTAVERLLADQKLIQVDFQDDTFYICASSPS